MPTRLSCTRLIKFDAAHRIMLHESKCKMLHGHGYVLEATFDAKNLDSLGRVIDFGVIKEKLGGWINAHWDHATILFDKDAELGAKIAEVTGQKIYFMPANPTAENMAAYLLNNICPALFADTDVMCTKIRLWETTNCYADAEL